MTDIPTPTLRHLLERAETRDDGLAVHISPNWTQGRTAFGGVTAALALSAARRAVPDLPRLRSSQIAFLRPLGEEALFRPRLLRAGRSSSFVSVDCEGPDGLAARALFTFGGDRPSNHAHDHSAAQELPAPEDSPPFGPRGAGPGFLANFDMRLARGDRLISGSERPDMTVWSRLLDAEGVAPDAALICVADALPPAAMIGFRQPKPISTITWALDFARIPERPGWIAGRSRSVQAAEGYSLQRMELRDRDGRLVALAQQLVALFD